MVFVPCVEKEFQKVSLRRDSSETGRATTTAYPSFYSTFALFFFLRNEREEKLERFFSERNQVFLVLPLL